IRKESGDSEVFLLGILKGATCLTADLLRAVGGPVSFGFVDVVRDLSDNETATAIELDFLSYTDISGRNVYVLKDIVTTGIIESYLLAHLRQERPSSLKLVALLDRPEARTTEVRTDHHLFKVGEGTFVGYGLEFEGRLGNLSHIARVG
ncbi:MAG TPA: phosphoribosyltransferase family protein, partial [Bauldia sp.]|nr:phosphoribosyltransferase family protein [Bauldia sp.]